MSAYYYYFFKFLYSRKRRLLQADHADGSYTSFRLAKPNNSGKDERRIPKLEPLTPWRGERKDFRQGF